MGEPALRPGDADRDRYDRSKRFGWFDRDAVRDTAVLVVGAGALGNETCKDLILSGFRNISLVDMDHVVRSNRNRCLFFSDADARQRRDKARVIADKAAAFAADATITPHVERIQDLPGGFIARHDVVLGCLDNIEARLHVNAHAYRHGIPYIDGGTRGLVGKVQVVVPPDTSCLECGMNATHHQVKDVRYSCTGDDVTVFEPKMASDVNTTSIISAVQVQEALKLANGRRERLIENMLYYDGNRNVADVVEVPIAPACPHHDER